MLFCSTKSQSFWMCAEYKKIAFKELTAREREREGQNAKLKCKKVGVP